jgi:hypothetical protein
MDDRLKFLESCQVGFADSDGENEEVCRAQERADAARDAFLANWVALEAEKNKDEDSAYADVFNFDKPMPWWYRMNFLPQPIRLAMNIAHCTLTGLMVRLKG